MMELYCEPPVFCMTPGSRPRASALARYLSQRGRRLINLRHESMEVYELHARLVSLLDGTRTREQLAAHVVLLTSLLLVGCRDQAAKLAKKAAEDRQLQQQSDAEKELESKSDLVLRVVGQVGD